MSWYDGYFGGFGGFSGAYGPAAGGFGGRWSEDPPPTVHTWRWRSYGQPGYWFQSPQR